MLLRAARRLPGALRLAVACGIAALALSACSGLPTPMPSQMPALLDTRDTAIAQAVAPAAAAHPGQSGIYMLRDGREAFAARAVMANAAERTLDVQYYIWDDDITGTLLFNALDAAAQRGVRVRLLLDDNNTKGLDARLALLDAHPAIEVRLFNPFKLRSVRALGYLTDFSRLNRRMHNKSFTVDGHATIVGGRNVGDAYFGAAGEVLFADLDVLAVGPVVADVEQDFDQYWNSASSYALGQIVPSSTPEGAAEVARAGQALLATPQAQAYIAAIRDSPFIADLRARRVPFEWATTRLVSDSPAKGLGKAAAHTRIMPQMRELIGTPTRQFALVSPYFVPGADGAAAFADLARKGVDVRVLTNSLGATDVAAVHAGYAKRRKALLEGGVHLYELRRTWSEQAERRSGPFGSSASSLHAKTFAVDGDQLFIGSFNFDPRSNLLNTEMGFIIDSPKLAQQLSSGMATGLPDRAYEVQLSKEGKLIWLEHKDGALLRHTEEPEASFWRKLQVSVLGWLPIEWLL
ncbi:phospholipase D family protein [Massilia sp. DWR3-1-1]|uniref:phospholipase D family protein n=1 Tax=Massilia sp. DWR3-1-1 TaxID=2804559 RepID=UPI003CF23E1F